MKSGKSNQPGQPRRWADKFRFSWIWIYFIVLSYAIIAPFFESTAISGKETTWQQFQSTMLNRNAVDRLEVLNNEKVEVYIKKSFAADRAFKDVFKPLLGDSLNSGPHFYFIIGSVETFERKMDEAENNRSVVERVPVTYRYERGTGFWSMVRWLLPFVLIFFFIRYLVVKSGAWQGRNWVVNRLRKHAPSLIEKETNTEAFANVAEADGNKIKSIRL